MFRIKLFILVVVVAMGLTMVVSAAPAGVAAPANKPGVQALPAGTGISGQPGQPVQTAPKDIHDIRHPVQVGVNPAIYYWTAGGIAALLFVLAAGLLLRRYMKRRQKSASDVTATVYKSPEEEILAGLEALEQEMPDYPPLFYFRLSALFRYYLQRRFELDAPEMTTEELLPHLSGLDLGRERQAGLKTFLRFGDQVKFARATPDRGDMEAHLTLIREMAERFTATASPAGPEGDS